MLHFEDISNPFSTKVRLFVLAILSAMVTWMLWFCAAALDGAGDGIGLPGLIISGPFGIYIYLWPFLMTLGNFPQPRIRLAVKTAACFYYLWLVVHLSDLLILPGEFSRVWDYDFETKAILSLWSLLVLLTHGLIWLPTLIPEWNRTGERSGSGAS